MAYVPKVISSGYLVWSLGSQKFVFVTATGEVPTSGWSAARLAPRFYVQPPPDGVWDFDFLADTPQEMVLQIHLSVTAQTNLGAPDWLRGIRIHDATSPFMSTLDPRPLLGPPPGTKDNPRVKRSTAIVTQELASFDDSYQPTGNTSADWSGIHIEMKKLHHTLVLTISGPDEGKIRSCISQAAAAGLIAAIVAVYATGGGGLSAATSAFLSTLTACLGDGFDARIDDHSYWITWWT